jgi:signal transduction histidine kinase
VEAHGGRLWLDEGAQGGAIRFTLPIAKPPKS